MRVRFPSALPGGFCVGNVSNKGNGILVIDEVLKSCIQLAVILLFLLVPSSCMTLNVPEPPFPTSSSPDSDLNQISYENLNNVRKSFLQLKKSAEFKFCKPETKRQKRKRKKKGLKRDCSTIELRSYGSSFAIGFAKMGDSNGSLVVTAGHICEDGGMVKPLEEYNKGLKDVEIIYSFTDIKGRAYTGTIIDYDTEIDMCLVFVSNFETAYVPASRRPLRPGDKVWNVAAPTAEFHTGMVPVFQGYYSGIDENGKSSLTVPATHGSSGSPIVNSHGELVGVLIAMHRDMNHISYSPSMSSVYKFIIDSCNQCGLRYFIVQDKLGKIELELEKPE
tara:strand:- start:7920 stop:8921 length:1002 start_codon:yes stop_codon:yes gene_type:complete